MLPYSMWILITGLALTFLWIALGLPLGPGAPGRRPIIEPLRRAIAA
jgi:p-aminobenzoyl-glutamate transporter AbgT